MATKNDITGDSIYSKLNNDKYRDGWDAIFGNKKKSEYKLTDDEMLIYIHDIARDSKDQMLRKIADRFSELMK